MEKRRLEGGVFAAGFWQTLPGMILTVFLSMVFFFAVCMNASSTAKVMGLVMVIVAVAAIWLRASSFRERICAPLVMLTLLTAMNGISTLYATSGKFALSEFLKILVAYCLALVLLAFAPKEEERPGRWIATILEGGAAVAGLVSIDLISTHFLSDSVLAFLELFSKSFMSPMASQEFNIT